MGDEWKSLGLTVRAASQRIDGRLSIPLLVDGPSRLAWDWDVEGSSEGVVFVANFTPHERETRVLATERAKRRDVRELSLESRGTLVLEWSHTSSMLQWVMGAPAPRLGYRVHLCAHKVIQTEEEEQAVINASIVKQHVIPPRIMD